LTVAETNGTATTWGSTLKLEDLKRLERELELMPKPQWALIAPDGRTWMDADPQKLLRVLALACYPLMGTDGVGGTDGS
jgi:hypothetical protein